MGHSMESSSIVSETKEKFYEESSSFTNCDTGRWLKAYAGAVAHHSECEEQNF